jgi:hypothetical protein
LKRRYVVLSLTVVLALALAVPAFGGPTNIVSALTKVKKTANKALKQAGAASAAAAAAQSTANSAAGEASTASKAAKAAQTTANDGLTAAKAAQTTANSALTTANSAKTDAAGAKATADAAAAAAAAAQATADSKFGQVDTVTGPASALNKSNGLSFAECPAGSVLTGGGYRTSGGGTSETVPFWNGPYGNAWLADLEGIGGEAAATWSVVGLAQCAKP